MYNLIFVLITLQIVGRFLTLLAHPDDFITAVKLPSAEERFVSVVKYYLNSIYPARKSGVAKKPYNPILGEIFRCRWTVPGLPLAGKLVADGPFPDSDYNQVFFYLTALKLPWGESLVDQLIAFLSETFFMNYNF